MSIIKDTANNIRNLGNSSVDTTKAKEIWEGGIAASFDSIEEYQKKIKRFDNVSEASVYTEFEEGDRVKILGYTAKNDGGGFTGEYNLVDEGLGISVLNGFVNIKISNAINIRQAGFKDGGFDNTALHQKLTNFLKNNRHIKVVVSNGEFVTNHISDFHIDYEYNNGYFITTAGQYLNSYANKQSRLDKNKLYSWSWLKLIDDGNPWTEKEVIFSGDSTTFGVNAAGYEPHKLFKDSCEKMGINHVDTYNRGYSGETVVQWNSTRLAQDISSFPNMNVYVHRWGLNDAVADDPDSFKTNLRAGLTTLRAFKDVFNLTIVLMTPNTSFQTDRQEDWLEKIVPIIKQAANDFQCVYIDTYGSYENGRTGTEKWFDDANIHPDKDFNRLINNLLVDALLKPIQSSLKVSNNFFNLTSEDKAVLKVPADTDYEYGLTSYRVFATSGWKYDGIVNTFVNADGVALQTLIGYADEGDNRILQRTGLLREGLSKYWNAWTGEAIGLNTLNGWSNVGTAAGYSKTLDGTVIVEGILTRVSGGISVIATLPDGYRPRLEKWFTIQNDDGTLGRVKIETNGNITYYAGDINKLNLHICFFAA